VEAYVPAGSSPGVFTTTLVNPKTTSAGVLGGQLLAATLNQQFTASMNNLSQLSFSDQCTDVAPIIRGLTVTQLIYIANQVIAGSTSTLYAAFTPSILNVALTLYNEFFDGCRDATTSTCFECGSFNENDTNVGATGPTTTNELADPSLFIGLNVFIALLALLMIAIFLCAWYYRRNKTKKQARFQRS